MKVGQDWAIRIQLPARVVVVLLCSSNAKDKNPRTMCSYKKQCGDAEQSVLKYQKSDVRFIMTFVTLVRCLLGYTILIGAPYELLI